MLLYSQRFAAPSAALSHFVPANEASSLSVRPTIERRWPWKPNGRPRPAKMSPLTLGRRRLRFPDPPCPRGSSLWDARRKNACVPQGGERNSWEQKPAMLVPGKSLRSPFQDRSHAAVRVHQVRRSKQRKRPGLSPASKKSEVIHLRRDSASALAWNALAGLVFESPSASGCYFRLSARPWIAVFLFFFFFASSFPANWLHSWDYTACPRCLNSSMFACGWLPCARAICTFPLLSKDRVAHGRLGRPAMWPPDTRASRHS